MPRLLLNFVLAAMAFQLAPLTPSRSIAAFQLAPLTPSRSIAANTAKATPTPTQRSQVILHSSKKEKKSSAPFDENLRTKLVSESIAPWRGLRLFLYGSAASGAAVGGFITLTGALAAMSGARSDVDLNVEVIIVHTVFVLLESHCYFSFFSQVAFFNSLYLHYST